MRDMHSVDIQYPQILREDDCFPPLFRRTRGRPKEKRSEKVRKKQGVCREVRKQPVRWRKFRTMLPSGVPSVVMWVTTEPLAMKFVSVQLYAV